MKRLIAGIALAALALAAWAQTPNVVPETTDVYLEVDIRLHGPATATNPAPVVRLIQGVRFQPVLAQNYRHAVPCWRDPGVLCPRVVGVSWEVFLNVAGTGRIPITYALPMCNFSTRCWAQPFPAIQARGGQSYHFHYSRRKADWVELPSVK
jgi:hypothetical protein